MSAENIRATIRTMVDLQRDSVTPVFDQPTARALVDAGMMPLAHYLDCCRQFGWQADRGRPLLRVVAEEDVSNDAT